MATAVMDKITFTPASVALGAYVEGLAIDAKPNEETTKALRYALHEHGVLFFDFGRVLRVPEFQQFATIFGDLEDGYRISAGKGYEPDDDDGPVMDSEKIPIRQFNIDHWHNDGALFEEPPQGAILTCVEAPELGGETMWASGYAAFDALSPPMRGMLEQLDVLHSSRRLLWMKEDSTAVHPAVIRDPLTGRKALYVNSNYSDRIIGLSDRESETILQMLWEHINTPEFHVRFHWAPGRVAIWDQRVTFHRGIADFKGPRKLRRITYLGERPAR